MASLTIRNLDDDVMSLLRIRAAENCRSMEEEARLILREAVGCKSSSRSFGEAVSGRISGQTMVWNWSCH